MIIGIGHDLTELSRMKTILASKSSSRFLKRILTEKEYKEYNNITSEHRKVEYAAGRFAAKESISKAFGCGIGSLISFHDIEISREATGKPSCGVSKQSLEKLGFTQESVRIHITITHERELASAFAVVENV